VIRKRTGRTRASAALLGLALASLCGGLVVGCGSQTATGTTPSPQVVTAPLATSLVTAQGAWAIAVMGRPTGSANGFWQLFARPAGSDRW
jgi:hypothetical protein